MDNDYGLGNRRYVVGGVAVVIIFVYIIRLFTLQIMSDDLISRKAVLEILYDISNRNYGSLFGHGINKACDVVEHAETAFDKEKVKEELIAGKFITVDGDAIGKSVYIRIDRAVEIVEKGGIE